MTTSSVGPTQKARCNRSSRPSRRSRPPAGMQTAVVQSVRATKPKVPLRKRWRVYCSSLRLAAIDSLERVVTHGCPPVGRCGMTNAVGWRRGTRRGDFFTSDPLQHQSLRKEQAGRGD